MPLLRRSEPEVEPEAPVAPMTRTVRSRPLVAASHRMYLEERRRAARDAAATSGANQASMDADLWRAHDEIPEVKGAARFMGNSMSRLRLFPAFIVDPTDAPVPLHDLSAQVLDPDIEEAERPDERLVKLAADAQAELDRLGDMADLLYAWGVMLFVPGDSWLVGRPSARDDLVDDAAMLPAVTAAVIPPLESDAEETWEVYAPDCVTFREDGVALRDKPGTGDKGLIVVPDTEDVVTIRVWRRHPHWRGLPDSNLRSMRHECAELLAHNRLFRAITNSRTMGGILKLPVGLDKKATRPVETGADDPPGGFVLNGSTDGSGELSPVEATLLNAWAVAMSDFDVPEAIAPVLLRGEPADLGATEFLPIDRAFDTEMLARVEYLVSRVANGADLPREVVLGVGDTNHWTTWQIEDSTYKAYVEPTASIPARALAKDLVRVALTAKGHAPELVRRVVLGIDPNDLVVRPNRSVDALAAFERGAIGHAALRKYLAFPDGDAPTPVEFLLQIMEKASSIPGLLQAILAVVPTPDEFVAPDVAAPAPPGDAPANEGEDGAGGEGGGETTPDTAPNRSRMVGEQVLAGFRRAIGQGQPGMSAAVEAAIAAATATAAGYAVRQVGSRLAAIDGALTDRIAGLASAEMTATLRRAGNRLRGRVQGLDPSLRAQANALSPEDVPAFLVAQGVVSEADVEREIEGSFASVEAGFRAQVDAAHRDAVSTVADIDPDVLDADGVEEAAGLDRGNVDAAWGVLLAGLLVSARSRLTAPTGAVTQGEASVGITVPYSLVRSAVTIAGGGSPALGAQARAYGVAYSPDLQALLGTLGIRQDSQQWQTGSPTRPFEPHQELDGLEFVSWDDPRLANNHGWPDVAFYEPQDHDGCQCQVVPILSLAPTEE